LDEIAHIIEGCRRQDRKSQEKLYRQFYPALFALCRSFFENKHDSLTALNNGMLRVFKNIERFDNSRGSFFNWVYTIVRNAALTQVRNNKSENPPELLTDDMHSLPDHNPFIEKDWPDIYKFLGQLPVTTRAVCTLYYLEGYSLKEISVALEMKEGTIKWHLNESRKRLKNIIRPNLKESE
jgi:RNA polymerase sigma-70 factor (ECF subfamily)